MREKFIKELENMQLKFRGRLARLKEIRDLDSDELTDSIKEERDLLLESSEGLKAKIEAQHKRIHKQEKKDLAGPGFRIDGERDHEQTDGYSVRAANASKDFRSLWGGNPLNTYRWDNEAQGCGFYEAIFSGRHHPGLTTRAMTESGSGSEGGFLVPVEYAEEIHSVSLENEIVMPRALVVPMRANDKKIPAMDIGDHSSNLYGGFTASYSPEAGTLSQNNPKARQIALACKKLYGFLRFSNELFEDIPGTGRQITEICGKGLAFYRDRFFLKGSGTGQPMGVLNSACLVEVAKENGQTADTITYGNVLSMLSRLWAGSFLNSVWVAHPSTIPQLGILSVDVGTGGSVIPVMKESNGQFSILTRPVIFSEKMETLGNKGDLMLCDFSQYVIGLREEMRIDFSPHLYFSSDEMAARLIERHDGQALWDEALILENGTTTVSPFVTLAERA